VPILSSADWPAVRSAISVNVTQTLLTDSVIAQDIYWAAAEDEILLRDPNAASYAPAGSAPNAAKWSRVRRAAIFTLAARLAEALPPPVTLERQGDYEYQRKSWDPEERADDLRQLANQELAAYLNASGRPRIRGVFRTVAGTRFS
jgi:hypothetical protein